MIAFFFSSIFIAVLWQKIPKVYLPYFEDVFAMCDEASRPEHMVRSSLVAYKVQQREKILVHYFEKSSNSVVVADSRLNNLVVSSIFCLRPLMAF